MLDMSTAAVSMGKLPDHAAQARPIPAIAFGSRGMNFSHALQHPVSAMSAPAARAGHRDAAAASAGGLPLGHRGRARVEFCEEKYIGMEL
jgi:LDH2 family malate/lactate/ureidoglycolate dehydrogenase